MGAIMMVAANDGINRETGYGHEREKKNQLERHYIPLPPAYEIRQGQLDGGTFTKTDRLQACRALSLKPYGLC